ncbi:hypothetical protein D3C87_1541330 [compost metagenome]
MPASSGCLEGKFVKKDQLILWMPLLTISISNTNNVNKAIHVQPIANTLNRLSCNLGLKKCFLFIALVVFFPNPKADVIQQESEQK